MAEYRQLTDGLDPTSAPDVLSESTDLDALFVAIVGEKRGTPQESLVSSERFEAARSEKRELNSDGEDFNDARFLIGSMETAVAPTPPNVLETVIATEDPTWSADAPQPSHDEPAPPQCSASVTADDTWAAFPPESARETMEIAQEDRRLNGDAIPESILDLTALRERLQGPHRERNGRTREDVARPTAGDSATRIEWEFITPTRAAAAENAHTERVLAFDSPDALDALPRQAEFLAVDRPTMHAGSRRVALILVAVAVVVSGAIISVRAIPRATKIAEPPTAEAPDAPETRLSLPPSPAPNSPPPPAAEAAPVTPAAALPGSRVSPTDSRGNDARTTQPSNRDVRRSNATSAASRRSPLPNDGPADRADVSIEPARPAAAEATRPPARELESSRSDTSVLRGTTAPDPAGTTVEATTPPPATAPQRSPAEVPAVTAAPEPPKSAVAAVSRTAPRLLEGSTPDYPKVLRSRSIAGIVDVQVTIDATGRVTDAVAVSGPGPLRELAARAVRSWRYQPATVNGVQTASTTTVSFHFREK